MQFKASTDYGLRAVLYLAAQGHTCSSKDIAQDMSIPRDYLIQLAQLLRNAGIIEARPGKHGGYRLANDPSKITLLQVVNALDDDAKDTTRTRRKDRADASMVQGISLCSCTLRPHSDHWKFDIYYFIYFLMKYCISPFLALGPTCS